MGRLSASSLKYLAVAIVIWIAMPSTRLMAQGECLDIDAGRQTFSAPPVDPTADLGSQDRAHQDVSTTVARRPGPYGRPFLAVLGAVPLVTYVGPLGPRSSDVLFPADRFVMGQLIGAGYVVNPRFRFGVMGVFSEALTGVPNGAPNWQLGGVAPVAIGTFNHFIIGGGPIIGYRSGGTFQSDIGAVVLTGASIPIRKGLALNIVTPVTAMFAHRTTASAGVAVGVSKIF